LIPVDTVPAGYTREDVGSIPTPGHLQKSGKFPEMLLTNGVGGGAQNRRKSFRANDLRQFFRANTVPKKLSQNSEK
jgi:hypothetical protein